MNVLLIAPRTDLLYADAEVQRILRSGLKVTPLLGTVDQAMLLDEVGSGGYDVLWMCSHGTAEGIVLSDGLLPSATLAQVVRGSEISLVVLNTCDSLATAQELQNETNAGVIATILSVPDREAFQTGVLFARALAQTNNVAAAYKQARPGSNRSYIHLGGNVASKRDDTGLDDAGNDIISATVGSGARDFAVGKGNNQLRSGDNYFGDTGNAPWITAQILDHSRQLSELTYRLNGIPNEFRILQAEVQKLKDVEITVRENEIVIKSIRPPDSVVLPMHLLLTWLAVALVLVLVAVIYLLWQVTSG